MMASAHCWTHFPAQRLRRVMIWMDEERLMDFVILQHYNSGQ